MTPTRALGLFAALNVHQSDLAAWVTDSTRSETSSSSSPTWWTTRPRASSCTASSTTSQPTSLPQIEKFLDDHHHVFVHNTPTHASWSNQVELFFSILERRLLRHGEFSSVDELAERIIAFINDYNRKAKPFRWTYDGRPLRVA